MLQSVMTSKRSRRRATYEDLLKVPDHLIAELIDGEIYTSARPAIPHTDAGSSLVMLLGVFHHRFGNRGGWKIHYEPEIHLGEDVVVPDIAGWRTERVSMLAPAGAKYATVAPDWLCEVLSPSTERFDRTKKLRVYAREGVRHVWLLDPVAKTFEVLTLNGKKWATDTADETVDSVRAVPFDAIAIPLGDIWNDSPPGTTQH
jgi:Uma2 family endonuclease